MRRTRRYIGSLEAIESGGGLEAWVCVEGDCEIGRASISRMMSTYKQFFDSEAYDHSKSSSWEEANGRIAPMVRGIKDAFDAADNWKTLVPFSPRCCTLRQLGARADEVTAIILREMGATEVPGGLSPPVEGTPWLSYLIITGLVVGGGVVAYRLLKK